MYGRDGAAVCSEIGCEGSKREGDTAWVNAGIVWETTEGTTVANASTATSGSNGGRRALEIVAPSCALSEASDDRVLASSTKNLPEVSDVGSLGQDAINSDVELNSEATLE